MNEKFGSHSPEMLLRKTPRIKRGETSNLLAQGLTIKEIAQNRGVSIGMYLLNAILAGICILIFLLFTNFEKVMTTVFTYLVPACVLWMVCSALYGVKTEPKPKSKFYTGSDLPPDKVH